MNVTVSGTINITTNFQDDIEVTAIPCFSTIYCMEKHAQNLGTLCDLVTNDANEDCGTPGIYTVNEMTYPITDSSLVQSIMGMATIRLFLDYDSNDECSSTSSTATSSNKETTNGKSSSFLWFYSSSLIPLIGFGWLLHRRQQSSRRPVLVLEGVTDNFVEMKDIEKLEHDISISSSMT